MPFDRTHISTGLPGLDQVFTGLRAGDNVVWQVDSLDDYAAFVGPFCRWARTNGRRLVYLKPGFAALFSEFQFGLFIMIITFFSAAQ